jgi:DNA-binding MarR family transcriptional regulator
MVEFTAETSAAERISKLLRELMSMIIQRSAGEMMCLMSEMGLSMPQMVTLHILRDRGPQTISAIADKLDLSLAATSHLVERMVQQRLVSRSEDAVDRRQKRVSIGDGGRAVLDRLIEARFREASQMMAALPAELRGQLAVALEQAVVQLKEEPVGV